MKVYWLDAHPNYKSYQCLNTVDQERMVERANGHLITDWESFEIEENSSGLFSNLTSLYPDQFIVSERGKELLERHVHASDVQYLPVHSPEGTWYILNVLHVLSAIDADNSDVTDSRGIYRYKGFELWPDILADHQLFKLYCPIDKKPLHALYMTDKLRDALGEELIGYQAIEMWNSEKHWKQAESEYNALAKSIHDSLVDWSDYKQAVNRIKRGLIVYNDKTALKDDGDGLLIGHLQPDGTYTWIDPMFIPPIYLTMKWGLKEPEPRIWTRVKDRLFSK